jgi:hypothetical protein
LNPRFSSPLFTERGFFLPVPELLKPCVDLVALPDEDRDRLLPELVCCLNGRHSVLDNVGVPQNGSGV